MSRWVAAAAGVLGVGLIGYALFAAKSDEEKIMARLDQLEEAIAVDEETSNPVIRMSHLNGEFAEIFSDDVTYSISELTSAKQGRKALAGLATKAGTYARTLDVDFTDVDIEITGSGTGAIVSSVAELRATRRGGRLERDDRRVRFEFLNGDDGWQIAHFKVSDVEQ